MSVIGRLDEQVEAIIIAPVAEKGKQRNETQQSQDEDKPVRSHTPTQSRSETERVSDDQERAANNRAQENELPVWLL